MLELSSVLLYKIGANNMPADLSPIASGCLCEFNGHRLLLTAGHVIKGGDVWRMAIKYIPGEGTELLEVGPMTKLAWVDIKGNKIEEIDLAFTFMPKEVIPRYRRLDERNFNILVDLAYTIHQVDFAQSPKRGMWYGFAGHTKPILESHGSPPLPLPHIVQITTATVPAIEYVGDEKSMHLFKILGPHPGHETFKGCSGAPIIDERGTVVALVCGGDVQRNLIEGISLRPYKAVVLTS